MNGDPTPLPEDTDSWNRGARLRRKAAAKLARNMMPAMPVPSPKDEIVKREAYRLAKANRHKPWARRYLRELRSSFRG